MKTRFLRPLAAAAALVLSGGVAACELDGLSHGYGPVSALFAGAHRYESMNGLEDEAPAETPEEKPVETPAEKAVPAAPRRSTATPPSPPRSFVAWAKARPKPVTTGEAPAAWVRPRER